MMTAATVCEQQSDKPAANKERGGEKGKKTGSMALNYTALIGGSVHGLGQGRTGNMRPRVEGRATRQPARPR